MDEKFPFLEPPALRLFERCSLSLLEGHVSTRDGDTLARLNRYRRPVG